MVNPRVVKAKEDEAGASTYVLCAGGRLGNKFEPLLHVHPVAAVLGDFLTGAARGRERDTSSNTTTSEVRDSPTTRPRS
jgi:hypothetical protein